MDCRLRLVFALRKLFLKIIVGFGGFQRLTERPLAQGSCLILLLQCAADTLDM